MKTLNLNQTIHGAGDLSDGVIIGIYLKDMCVFKVLPYFDGLFFYSSDSNHFDDHWLQKIHTDAGENSRIKVEENSYA